MVRMLMKARFAFDKRQNLNFVLRRLVGSVKKNPQPTMAGDNIKQVQYPKNSKKPRESHDGYQIVYRCKPVNIATLLSRLKLYQTALFVSGTPLAYALCVSGQMSLSAANTIAIGGAIATSTLMYFSYVTRRLVGLIWFNEEKELVKIAYLSFWGERKDITLPLKSLPLLDNQQENYTKPLVRLQMIDSPTFFFFSLRYGIVWDEELFQKLFSAYALQQYKRAKQPSQ